MTPFSELNKKLCGKHHQMAHFFRSPRFFVVSKSKKTGWMTTTDATAAFSSLRETVGEPKFATMIQALEETIAKELDSLSPLQKAQYEIQLDWLRKGEVPQVESVVFSMAVVQAEEGQSYFTILMGVQVWHSPYNILNSLHKHSTSASI